MSASRDTTQVRSRSPTRGWFLSCTSLRLCDQPFPTPPHPRGTGLESVAGQEPKAVKVRFSASCFRPQDPVLPVHPSTCHTQLPGSPQGSEEKPLSFQKNVTLVALVLSNALPQLPQVKPLSHGQDHPSRRQETHWRFASQVVSDASRTESHV